jgi:hypothetical protein
MSETAGTIRSTRLALSGIRPLVAAPAALEALVMTGNP